MTNAYLTPAYAVDEAVAALADTASRWRALLESVLGEFPPEIVAALGRGRFPAVLGGTVGILARAGLDPNPTVAAAALYLAAAYGYENIAADGQGVYAHVPRPSPVRRDLIASVTFDAGAVGMVLRYTPLTDIEGREHRSMYTAYTTEEVVEFLHAAWQATA